MQYIHHYISKLGRITLTSDGQALTGLWFEDKNSSGKLPAKSHIEKDLPVFVQTDRWRDIYFSGKEPDFTPPLSVHGTAFREMVWRILLTIPYGQTMSYGEIASVITARRSQASTVSGPDRPRMSAQAVGGAVGHNPISLIIPCHRVIGADGSLVGYAGGHERKKALLKLEKVL